MSEDSITLNNDPDSINVLTRKDLYFILYNWFSILINFKVCKN